MPLFEYKSLSTHRSFHDMHLQSHAHARRNEDEAAVVAAVEKKNSRTVKFT